MFALKKDTIFYQNNSYEGKHLIWNLLSNAHRTLQSVYLFQHFEEYSKQLNSDNPDDKSTIYWNASYHEKLIDYIKISVAFESYNKAVLINHGILVHKIDRKFNRALNKLQNEGQPVKIEDFLKSNYSNINLRMKTAELNGFDNGHTTINYAHTLNDKYQDIIQLDKQLAYELKKINQKRNKLHFYTDFTGAFSVPDHLKKWQYIKTTSTQIIGQELKKQELALSEHKQPFYDTF